MHIKVLFSSLRCSVLMECFLEHLQNALFVLDASIIPPECIDALGIYQSGASAPMLRTNLNVLRGSGRYLKKQAMIILLR